MKDIFSMLIQDGYTNDFRMNKRRNRIKERVMKDPFPNPYHFVIIDELIRCHCMVVATEGT